MPISVVCPKCQSKMLAPDAAAGKAVRCKCGGVVPVTATQSPSSGAPAAKPVPKPATAGPGPGKPTAVSAKSGAPVASAVPSFLDQLTDKDMKQAEINPYAPPPKAGNSDAKALKTYVGENAAAAKKASSASSNLVLLQVFNLIGFVVNLLAGIGLMALASNPGQLQGASPLFGALGIAGAIVMFVFAVYDLVTAIGLMMRGAWGWWLGVIGLGWGIGNYVLNAGLGFLDPEQLPRAIGGCIGALIGVLIAGSLMKTMIEPETQKRFGLKIGSGMAWGIGLGAGITGALILGGLFFALGVSSAAAAPVPSGVGAPGAVGVPG